MGWLSKIGNSLGIKPLSETLTLNNLVNLGTNPTGMSANAVSRNTGGSGNAGADVGLGNSLTGTGTQDIVNRFGVGAAVAGLGGVLPEVASGLGLDGVTKAANDVSAATGGSGSAWGDLTNGVTNNLGQLVGGAAGIYNANQQGQAAQDIASQQMALQRPYYDAGTAALGNMTRGVDAYQQDPYNKWLQDQGSQQISRSAAAKGMGNSGNVLTALSDYGQKTAGAGYQDWFGNQSTIAGYGSPAATAMGNSFATGRQGSADANSGTTSSILNTLNNILNNPTQQSPTTNSGVTDPYAAWKTPGINSGATGTSLDQYIGNWSGKRV